MRKTNNKEKTQKNQLKVEPNVIKIKQVKSFKNLQESKENLTQQEISRRMHELRSLTQEKDKLMEELNILKEGAITALIEKQQIIDRLRNQSQIQEQYEDQRLQMQRQLNKMTRKCKDLEEDKKQLIEKLENEKKFYFEELYSRQTLIDALDSKVRLLEQHTQNLTEDNRDLLYKIQCWEKQHHKNMTQQQLPNKKQTIEQIYKTLEQAQTEEEIMECLYEDQIQSLHPQEGNKRVQEIIEKYEIRIKQLMEQLENKEKFQILKQTLETQTFLDKAEYDRNSIDSMRIKKIMNLKNDIKDIDSITYCKKNQDENESQFTIQHFKYNPSHKSIINSAEKMNIQEQYEIQSECSETTEKSPFEMRDIAVGLVGGVVGASLMGFFFKYFRK